MRASRRRQTPLPHERPARIGRMADAAVVSHTRKNRRPPPC
ncbi:hypothetical protein C7S16_3679 [Burkholderia thailandensis]|uniref:Uncharacterized protein n=1 Tax=Burkholderia thailandensis TaxID=57975 RepID=A0AAW9D1L5_BURTH|nr:hypothetical protein [Burkholderia thailandensis]MDW9256071.1 hypothetical protein [Burkholderia thailandensis]